jgi:hypothetical protein
MKKSSIVIIVMLLSCAVHACVIIPKDQSSNALSPLTDSAKMVQLSAFITMTPSDYKKMTGEKMSLKELIGFKLLQCRLKCLVRSGALPYPGRLEDDEKGDASQHIGWFALGFVFMPYGLIIALLLNDGKKSDRIKWIAIGSLTLIVFVVALIAAYIGSGGGYR